MTYLGFVGKIKKEYRENILKFGENHELDFKTLLQIANLTDFNTWISYAELKKKLGDPPEEYLKKLKQHLNKCTDFHFLIKDIEGRIKFKTKLSWNICKEFEISP